MQSATNPINRSHLTHELHTIFDSHLNDELKFFKFNHFFVMFLRFYVHPCTHSIHMVLLFFHLNYDSISVIFQFFFFLFCSVVLSLRPFKPIEKRKKIYIDEWWEYKDRHCKQTIGCCIALHLYLVFECRPNNNKKMKMFYTINTTNLTWTFHNNIIIIRTFFFLHLFRFRTKKK